MPRMLGTPHLEVRGTSIDVVRETAGTLREVGYFHQVINVLRIASHLPQTYRPSGCHSIDAIWRALIADTFCSVPANEENKLDFRNFIIFCLWILEEAAKSSTVLTEGPESIENPHGHAYLDSKKLSKLLPQTQDMLERLAQNDPSGSFGDG